MRKVLFAVLVSSPLLGQSITWTKLANATNNYTAGLPYFTQWHKLRYNSYDHATMLWSNDSGVSLFGNALWAISLTSPATASVQKLGTSGSVAISNCSYAEGRWPGDRSVNGNLFWDSRRNRLFNFECTCNLGQPDPSDRKDNWIWRAHYPLISTTPSNPPAALKEQWDRIVPSTLPATQQLNGSGVYDAADDLYFSFGWGTSSEPPKFYCPTDLNPAPGTLTAVQSAAGCTSGDTWVIPSVSSFTCNGSACTNATLPQAGLIEGLFYDSTIHKILMVGELSGNGATFFNTVETWTYDVPTKAFTKLNPAQTPPLYWVTGDPGPPMDYNPNNGLYYFMQKESGNIAITNPGSGYSNGTYSVVFNVTGACTQKPSMTYTAAGGVVTSAAINYGTEPTVDCYSATLTPTFPSGGGSGAAGTFTWIAPDVWTYNAASNTWTALGIHSGPQNPGTCAFDSAWNALVCWEFRGPAQADLWIGKLSVATAPTVTALALPPATKGAAYSQQLTAAGDATITWSVATGSLPAGLALSSGGLVSGTPSAAGSSTFTVQAANGAGSATLPYTLAVANNNLSIPITAQEALYPGSTSGVARSNEAFCMGVPIPDSAQIDATTVSTLGVSGASAAQFRILGVWPDGYAKWIKTCAIVANLGAGGTQSLALTNTGSGNTGGANLATDNGSTITVNTTGGACGQAGATCFTLNKKQHNGFDKVQIGSTTVVASGASQGWVLTGPDPTAAYPGNVTCGSGSGQSPCTHLFTSAADSNAFCAVEENGPVMAAVKCSFIHEFATTISSITTGTSTVLNVADISFAGTAVPGLSIIAITGAQGCSALNGNFAVTAVSGSAMTISANTSANCAYAASSAIGGLIVGGAGAKYQYMNGLVRYYFYQGKNFVKITQSLENSSLTQYCRQQSSSSATCVDFAGQTNAAASFVPSNTGATAFKGFQAYELRLQPNIAGGALNYSIANHAATPTTGTLTGSAAGSDFVYLYQGRSQSLLGEQYCYNAANGLGCVPPTLDTGYGITGNAGPIASGNDAQYPQGWADIANGSGVGVGVGVYQLAAVFPKSLEFNAGGTDVRIGVWPRQNSQPYYAAWPQQTTHDVWLNFHTSVPSSPANEFLKFQHYLVGRAAYQSYNAANVFPYQLIDPATEDNYYRSMQSSSITPTPSGSTTISSVSTTRPVTITLASSSFAASLSKYQWLNVSGAIGCSALNTVLAVWNISGATLTVQVNGLASSNLDTSGCGGYTANSATIRALSPIGASAACCIQDLGISSATWPLSLYRYWYWASTGGSNQDEFRWSDLMNFITRGMTGRYLLASHWYRHVEDGAWPRSLGFDWRATKASPPWTVTRDGFGFPNMTSANSTLASRWWISSDTGEHGHWYGMPDYYFMTGDEAIKDALLDGPKDWFLMTADKTWNPSGPYQSGNNAGAGLYNSRAVGANLAGAAYFSSFLSATGDADAAGVLNMGIADYNNQVAPVNCLSGYPAGCSFGTLDQYPATGSWTSTGVSRTRGIFTSKTGSTGGTWCQASHTLRFFKPFMTGILVKGILRLREVAGPNWSDYWNSLDLAYGVSRSALTETYYDDLSGRWDTMGFRYQEAPDWANNCTGAGEAPQADYGPQPNQTIAPHFLVKYLEDGGTSDWMPKFTNYLQRNMASSGVLTSDFGSIIPEHIIGIINNPSPVTLQNVPISSVQDNGGGSYTISWTGSPNAQFYRVKWGAKQIVDWIGFDSGNNVFTGDPVNTMPWFAANNATGIPAPASGTQSLMIATGTTGLIPANFSVKAMTPSGPLTNTAQPLPATTAGSTIYSQSLAAWVSGGTAPYSGYIIASGALPAGLTLDASTGVISGTVAGGAGIYSFTVSVSDAFPNTATSGTASISVNAAPTITTASPLPGGTTGAGYAQTLAATGGTTPLAWDVSGGALPAGIALSPDGTVSGTPTQAGTFNFTARITDASSISDTKSYSLMVDAASGAASVTVSGFVSVSGKATLQ